MEGLQVKVSHFLTCVILNNFLGDRKVAQNILFHVQNGYGMHLTGLLNTKESRYTAKTPRTESRITSAPEMSLFACSSLIVVQKRVNTVTVILVHKGSYCNLML